MSKCNNCKKECLTTTIRGEYRIKGKPYCRKCMRVRYLKILKDKEEASVSLAQKQE